MLAAAVVLPVVALLLYGDDWVEPRSKPIEKSSSKEAGRVDTIHPEDVNRENINLEKATFGAGCFWGVEAAFRKTPGVISTAVGYSGGSAAHPTYKQVCTNTTGHAEAVQVEYDPGKVSYDQLLDVFWNSHDPTTLNRQGPDVGIQYRSVIFYHTPEQKAAAAASKQRLASSGRYAKPIVTQIQPAKTFWRAEEYHQQYLEKRGLSSCGSH